ncbi:MAG: hypothetical protein AB7R55_03080, partial [Gemmatimonadales bacterium]
TTIVALPADTVLVSVPPSTYRVTLLDLPQTCNLRGPVSQIEAIAQDVNTAIFRFSAYCQAQLVIENLNSGVLRDGEFVYRIRDSLGDERVGLIGGADTLLFDGLSPGTATVRLSHVSENCIIVTNGGAEQRILIPALGGAVAAFRVACSDPRASPILVAASVSVKDGFSGVVFHAKDPDRDLDRLHWDITDCRRRSLLPKGGRVRNGLNSGRTIEADSITALAVFETGMNDVDLIDGCVSLRVEDRFGNSSPFLELPIRRTARGSAPFPLRFNAALVGTAAIRTALEADDPEGDFLGVVATARLRDGVLFPKDGQPDIGVFNTTGYLDDDLPDVLLGNGRPPYTDYLAIILYLFDHEGNFVRIEDSDLFR